MNRSFSNRIFGGVCSGLASTLPFNAWIWRIIFIVLTLLTSGVGALVYILMWWILPLDSPLRSRGGAIQGLISILLGILLIGLWFGRESLNIADVYWAIAFLVLAIVFLLKQVLTRQGNNIALGLVAVAIPTAFLLQGYDVLQEGAIDIIFRSAPAILVFLGLSIALRYRVRFGSWIALLISIALVAGLATFAYNSRVDVISTANQISLTIPNEDDHDQTSISENITTLLVNVRTLDTDVTISVSDTPRQIQAEFIGSNNSNPDIAYSEDGDIASLQVIERQVDEFPLLENIGRGELRLQLPAEIAIGLDYNSNRAESVTLDMGELNLERLSFGVNEGDVLVRLPLYQPLSPSVVDRNGIWAVRDGNLQVIVPEELGVRLSFARATNAEPTGFDNLNYQLLIEGPDYVLASRQFDNLEAQMRFQVDVSGGRFQLDEAE